MEPYSSFVRGSGKRSGGMKIVIGSQVLVVALGLTVFSVAQPASSSTYAADDNFFTYEGTEWSDDGIVLADLTRAGTARQLDVLIHTVAAGDTLSSIAAEYGVSQQTLLWANNIADKNRLKTGQRITVLPTDGVYHTIASGETVQSIAAKYKVSADKITEYNKQAATAGLLAGNKLVVPDARPIVEPPKVTKTAIASRTAPARGAGKTTTAVIRNTSAPAAAAAERPVVASGPATADMVWPASGLLTQGFSLGKYVHKGIDINNVLDSKVVAAYGGTVITASTGWNGGYGNYVVIDHGDGRMTRYAHLNKITVEAGQQVGIGEQIGLMGRTGNVRGKTGIHVHFEVIVNGVTKNPVAYLK